MEWYMASYSTSIADASNLRAAMNTNSAYEGLCHPMKEEQGGTWKGRGTAMWNSSLGYCFCWFCWWECSGMERTKMGEHGDLFFSGKNYPKHSKASTSINIHQHPSASINIHQHPSSTSFCHPGGYMPDFNFRYLSEDVPTGLCFTRGVGELLGVKTPSIDKVLLWAQEKLKKEFIGKDGLWMMGWKWQSWNSIIYMGSGNIFEGYNMMIYMMVYIYIYIHPGRLVRRRRESKFSSGQPRYFSLIVTFGRGDSHCSCWTGLPILLIAIT